ncbi:hypothetical protein Ptr86124_013421 [Pyrenophora tritici-repentis]|uniref:Uncharacterized protein n=1 Tax=Pyrenophora tritici-repentis TaxID=45151 RepID=A0A922N0Y6_9PLEO|nr:hypothetical protein Ptr86124_013421 [Pyrenophora tritici-repentis]
MGASSGPSPESVPSSARLDHALNSPNPNHGVTQTTESISRSEEDAPSPPDLYPFLSKFLYRTEVTQSDLWLKDLELLHHWIIEAHYTLSPRDDIKHAWKIVAPKEAIKHAYLMHEMLAYAAFHKAHQQPRGERQEYFEFGIHHQDNAIRGIRGELQHITPDEAPSIVAVSMLLTLTVFASIGLEAEVNPSQISHTAIEGVLNCFNLIQGMGNVLALTYATVIDSFVAPMMRGASQPNPSQPMLQELVNQVPTLVAFIQEKSDLPEDERRILLEAIGHFEPVLQMSMHALVDNRELRFLYCWPLHLTPGYTNMVRQSHSGALSILMYYTTMIYAGEPRYWFLEGWGNRLMKSCYELIDRSWLPCLQWPMSFLPPEMASNLNWDLPRQSPLKAPWTRGPTISIPHRQPQPPGSSTSREGNSSSSNYGSPGDHKPSIGTNEASASRRPSAQSDQTQI